MMCKKLFGLALATGLAIGVVTSAQGPSEEWKARHDVGQRYEGIEFDPQVSAAFNLISFTALLDPDPRSVIDIKTEDEIVVDFYSRSAVLYTLIARELDRSKYYWMEPKQRATAVAGQNVFKGIWKTDVLRDLTRNPRTNVPVDGLGVLVSFYRDKDGVTYVAPAVMRAAGAKPPQTISAYRATFLPDMIIEDVVFSVRGGCQTSSKVFPGGGSVGRQLPGTSFYVDVEIPPKHTGEVMLEVTAAPDAVNRYCFWHPRLSP